MRKFLFFLIVAVISTPLLAQQTDDPVLVEIGSQKIRQSEFKSEFLRSIGQDPAVTPTTCTYEKRQKIEEYARLFVNFRTKLTDAYAMGYDTLPSLVRELATYRRELAQPYLMDSASFNRIMQEAYERNHYALHAAHILIRVERNQDSVEAYKMAMEAYQRALAGEDFYELASEMNVRQMTEEQKQQFRKNRMEGDLGCFTVFDMIYPFESAAYALQPGEISKPIRTRYGYHVIKLFSKTPFFGRVSLRHIWVAENASASRSKSRIDLAYEQLQQGQSFETVFSNNSDDASNPDRPGGLMSNMVSNQLPPEYVEQLALLKHEGDYSAPFHTSFGWHIVQLVHRDTIPPLSEMIPIFRQFMSRDARGAMPREEFVVHNLEKYNFVDYTKTNGSWKQTDAGWQFVPAGKRTKKTQPASSLDAVVAIATDSLFDKRWVFDSTALTDHRPLMELDGKLYTTDDFCRYLALNQQLAIRRSLDAYIALRYQNFIGEIVTRYVNGRLESDYPEFRKVMEEYRHGLMIFAYNDDMIWKVAASDSAGLQDFYNSRQSQISYDNVDDAVFFWNSRARVNIFTIADSSMLSPEKASKLMAKALKKKWSASDTRVALQKALRGKGEVSMSSELFEDEHQNKLSNNEWRPGVYIHPRSGKGYEILHVESILPPAAKELTESRGYYLNGYQDELERRLVERLREKYKVVFHQDVLDEITY